MVGTWKANVVDKDKQDTVGGEFAQRLLGMSLEFKGDGTCFLTVLVRIPGTYEVSGNRVTIHFPHDSKRDGDSVNVDVDKPFVLDVSGDGKTLTAENDDSSSKGDLVFERKSDG